MELQGLGGLILNATSLGRVGPGPACRTAGLGPITLFERYWSLAPHDRTGARVSPHRHTGCKYIQ
jgi:hypothetical protein